MLYKDVRLFEPCCGSGRCVANDRRIPACKVAHDTWHRDIERLVGTVRPQRLFWLLEAKFSAVDVPVAGRVCRVVPPLSRCPWFADGDGEVFNECVERLFDHAYLYLTDRMYRAFYDRIWYKKRRPLKAGAEEEDVEDDVTASSA